MQHIPAGTARDNPERPLSIAPERPFGVSLVPSGTIPLRARSVPGVQCNPRHPARALSSLRAPVARAGVRAARPGSPHGRSRLNAVAGTEQAKHSVAREIPSPLSPRNRGRKHAFGTEPAYDILLSVVRDGRGFGAVPECFSAGQCQGRAKLLSVVRGTIIAGVG